MFPGCNQPGHTSSPKNRRLVKAIHEADKGLEESPGGGYSGGKDRGLEFLMPQMIISDLGSPPVKCQSGAVFLSEVCLGEFPTSDRSL